MRVLLLEHFLAGGLLDSEPPSDALLCEASAMVRTILRGLFSISWVEPTLLVHSSHQHRFEPDLQGLIRVTRGSRPPESLRAALSDSDAFLLIAPETNQLLLEMTLVVESSAKKLLSPSSSWVRLFGDKWRTHGWLTEFGIRTPRTCLLEHGDDLIKTWKQNGLGPEIVVKPRDGCGSIGVQKSPATQTLVSRMTAGESVIFQEFVEGLPASISILSGPHGAHVLPPTWQTLGGESGYEYLGGRFPLDHSFRLRAERLGHTVAQHLNGYCGYLGIDLVLGAAEDGSEDFVIEINPRITTSVVALAAASETNFIEAMLCCCVGEATELRFGTREFAFGADGAIWPRE